MAYLKDLKEKCSFSNCSAGVTVELFNRVNAPCGKYCRKHGDQALMRLKRIEAEEIEGKEGTKDA